MKNFILLVTLFLSLFFYTLPGNAQKEKNEEANDSNLIKVWSYYLVGYIYEDITGQQITDATAEILSKDSTVLYKMTCNAHRNYYEGYGGYCLPLPVRDESYAAPEYILRFSKKGYETIYVDYTVPKKLYNRERAFLLKPIFFIHEKKTKQLGEATVTATKIKFYSKGDTLVYNADAFQLSEGSMLDALIRQLPGVELKDDGRILVNGEYVESLLLNGEDFFKEKSPIMLENLPSYMVKNVQVYKKAGVRSEMIGRSIGDEQLVLDVRLKKQYNIGWIGNVEAAGGTNDRYLAQIFALRFTPHSRLSFFGAMNNVNESRKPGENTEWTPDKIVGGITTTRNGGFDYLVDDRYKRFKLTGSAIVSHSDATNENRTSSVNFYSGGDTYGQNNYWNRSHDFSISSNHNLTFNWEKVKIFVYPDIYYAKKRQNLLNKIGSFSTNPNEYIEEGLLDSLFSSNFNTALLQKTLNRQWHEKLKTGHELNTGLRTWTTICVPHTPDYLFIQTDCRYKNNEYETFAHKLYDYPNDANLSTDFRNEYETSPYKSYNYSVTVDYLRFFGRNWNMRPFYKYAYSHTKENGSIYRLEDVDGFNGFEGWEDNKNLYASLGELPSITNWKQLTLDGNSTERTTQAKECHSMGISLHRDPMNDELWYANFYLPLDIEKERFDYERPTILSKITHHRTNVLFYPTLTIGNSWATYEPETYAEQTNHTLEFNLSSWSKVPSLYYKAIYNNSYSRDPLEVTQGNLNLKRSWIYNFKSKYSFVNKLSAITAGAYIEGNITQNALCMGYVYNRGTGKRTYTPDNVNGNWYINGSAYFSLPLDKKRLLTLNGNTGVTFNQNVDLIGFEGENDEEKQRSTVHNLYVSQKLRLEYNWGKVKLGIKGNGTWTHATSRREDFSTINAADFNYGLTFKADLPANFGISSDFTIYSRCGYEDNSMNSTDFVWNARISKNFLGGRVGLMLDGFDILNQLSNIQRYVNGQGRTETFYNTIPRYVMLHVVYRFNIK